MGEENLINFAKFLQKYEEHFVSTNLELRKLLSEKALNVLLLSLDPKAIEEQGLSFFNINA